MKVLITGASGMLGKALIFENNADYSLYGTYLSANLDIKEVTLLRSDICDKNSFSEVVSKIVPDIIIHTAALTNVDLCEKEKEAAYKINVVGTENVVESGKKVNAKLIYISTDFVFNGKIGNYTEEDFPNPINYYGITKLKGEEISLTHKKSLIIRTSIFGLNPLGSKAGIEEIVENVKRGKRIYAPVDSFYSPISVNSLAKIIYYLIEKDASGIYHVGSRERISRFEFFNLLFTVFGLPHNNLFSVPFEEYLRGKYARRPKDVSLASSKIVRVFGIDLPSVKSDLEEILRIKDTYHSFFGGKN
ncbi:SDR family oxidoreductase [Caldisericum sp.]|uniref:SDR family oxidoreductase n=1 Tax=Caldisericum sp. TaxID=2499687 RepID=UPI003D12A96E